MSMLQRMVCKTDVLEYHDQYEGGFWIGPENCDKSLSDLARFSLIS